MSGPAGGLYRFKGAPPRDVPFPKDANMTAVELLTFLPNHLTSFDVVYRFASNKATCHAMVPILYAHRNVTTPSRRHTSEYCHRTMRNIMREGGRAGWRLEEHEKRFEGELCDWDPSNLSVGTFRTRAQVLGESEVEDNVLFASLAQGVQNMPQGSDALDLTRMIEHCLRHPSENWMYPYHYKELLEKVGGGQPPTAANTDQEIFQRWYGKDSFKEPSSLNPMMQMESAAVGEKPVQQLVGGTPTPKVEAGSQKQRRSARKEVPSKKKRESLEDALSENEWQPPAKKRRSEAHPEEHALGRETREVILKYADNARPPLKWEKAPPTAGVMSIRALQFAFEAQRARDPSQGTDPYDAYAFGDGPRTRAPFRPLHLIQGVKCADLSGWAENLRWASEQYATFGEAGWTECPEHMQRIARIRQRRLWASGELMLSIQDKIVREMESEEAIEAAEAHTMQTVPWRESNKRLWIWGDLWQESFDASTGRWQIVRRQRSLHAPPRQ